MTSPRRRARVTIVTSGHLSTCPRMLKSADALAGAGYQVRVISVNHTPWATAADRAVVATRAWDWTGVDYSRTTARAAQVITGVRFRAAHGLATTAGAARVPFLVAARAYSRAHTELVRAATAKPADFVYGGTSGALAAIAESARRLGVPYGIDLEDFHSAEKLGPEAAVTNALAERIERRVLPGASCLTTSSPMIAEAYLDKYGVRPVPIHNTFSISFGDASDTVDRAVLRLYWFSQTLGPGRGIEDVVRAMGRAGGSAELHLRARPTSAYFDALQTLQRNVAPALVLMPLEPAAPDEMVRLAQGYEAGLSCEDPVELNHRLCLGNKIFTYLAAGVPVILSRTPAQAALAEDLGPAAFSYECGDIDGLAQVLRRLRDESGARTRSQSAARAAAERRWHWEHPDDRGALLAAVAGAVA
jgi:glycosyltransferase involved in cell wall biosynthesis